MPKNALDLTHDEKIRALRVMETYGGGFASRQALAWFQADEQNDLRLRVSLGHLLLEYHEMAQEIDLGHQT